MAGSFSDYLENAVLNGVLGGADFTRPATVYVALFTAAPSDAGGGTEVSGNNYSRTAITNNATNWPAASAGSKSNGTVITCPTPSGSWGTITHWGLFDASSSGNLLIWGELVGPAKSSAAVASTDVFTSSAHGLADQTPVRVETVLGAALPGGISAGTTYYIRDTATNTFKLTATAGGAAIDVTTDGSCNVRAYYAKSPGISDVVSFAVGTLSVSLD
jgi:hypothetical protein